MSMEIDIISYTDEQMALLTADQLQEVKSAQMEKNRLEQELQEKIREARVKFINNGTIFSKRLELVQAELEAQYNAEISWIREALLFYLHYASRPDGVAPYPLDYSLSGEERFYVVRDYYLEQYSDANERYAAFLEDTVAKAYLGELYMSLSSYFYDLTVYVE